jgi:hypothetical protein
METPVKLWLGMRAIRWIAWAFFLLYSLHYVLWPQTHLDHFSHLLPTTEVIMFGSSLFAVFAGMFELALRGRAGLAPPKFGRVMAPKAAGPISLTR